MREINKYSWFEIFIKFCVVPNRIEWNEFIYLIPLLLCSVYLY